MFDKDCSDRVSPFGVARVSDLFTVEVEFSSCSVSVGDGNPTLLGGSI